MRESEQLYRLLMQNVREYALLQTDGSGIVTIWNPGAERLFGYTTSEMVGQPAARLLTANDQRAKVAEMEIERVMRGEPWQDERWLVRKDGSRFWAHWTAEPVRDESGRPRGIAKVVRDDTEKRHAEQSFAASLAEKEALLNDIHHRTKNSLQLIASLISLQSNEVQDRHVVQMLDAIRNRVLSIAVVQDIVSRSQGCPSFDIAAYLSQLVPELVRLHSIGRQVEFRIDAEPGPLDLERAFSLGLLLNELISNACKHAFPSGRAGEVIVTAGRKADYTVLSVADNGVGLPPDLDYYRARSLGLKLVQMLAQRLGGEVNAVSNAGVRIEVSFPSSSVEGACA